MVTTVALLAAACGSSDRTRTPLAASGSLEAIDVSTVAGGAATEDGITGSLPDAAAGGAAHGAEGAASAGGRTAGAAGRTATATGGPVVSASQPTAGSGPGITDTEIRIGFIVPGTEQTE